MDESKRRLSSLSRRSSEFTDGARLIDLGGDVELRCTYGSRGGAFVAGVRFTRVRAYRFRAEGHCTAWHVEGAYEMLVEVEDSTWVHELLASEPSETWGHWKIRHFLIYVENSGAYEFAAEDFELLPEEAVS